MANEEISEKKLTEFKEAQATISFDIPAYTDDNGKPFQRTLKVPTKKAYAVYKRLVSKEQVE